MEHSHGDLMRTDINSTRAMPSSTCIAVSSSGRGRTRVEVERFTFDWVIKEFKFFPQKGREGIYSTIFRSCNNEFEWRLCLSPQNADQVSLDLCLHSHTSQTINIRVRAEISILPGGSKRTLKHRYNAAGKCRFDGAIERSELCGRDEITIRCEMQIPLRVISETIVTDRSMGQTFNSQEDQLIRDFRLLFKETKGSDIVLMVGDHRFPAHKDVLAIRSPVLAAMFEHKETKENLKNEIKIENMEPEVVKAMLEFIYTDEVTNLKELVYGLFKAAGRYELHRLRTMCEKVLHEELTNENAAEILVYADLHQASQLKEYVLRFMADHLPDVVKTETYARMGCEYPTLIVELVSTIAQKMSNE